MLLAALLTTTLAGAAVLEREILEFQPAFHDSRDAALSVWSNTTKTERIRVREGGDVLYDIVVQRDPTGFRKVAQVPARAKSHLFLAGCSYVFGQGVEDGEVGASLLSESLRSTRVVNMSHTGGGPASLLYLWEWHDWTAAFPQPEGVMVYVLTQDSIERLARSWRFLDWASPWGPVYSMAEGKLTYQGLLKDTAAYRWVSVLKRMGLWRLWLRGAHHFLGADPGGDAILLSRAMSRLKGLYQKQYPRGRFALTWYGFEPPWRDGTEKRVLLEAFRAAGIEVWPPQEVEASARRIPRDGHPNPRAHREQATFLATEFRTRR